MTVKFTEKQVQTVSKAEKNREEAMEAVGNFVFKEQAGECPCNVTLEVSLDKESIMELKKSLENLLKGSGQGDCPALQSTPFRSGGKKDGCRYQ